MLTVIRKYSELNTAQLLQVYKGSLISRQREEDFLSYLYDVFFCQNGAMYCIWEVDGSYLSALRLEPYLDGLLLTGLETVPNERNKGYARQLMAEAIVYLSHNNVHNVYSHVDKQNKVSMKLHLENGFVEILDYAKFLDGSISANAVTLKIDPSK